MTPQDSSPLAFPRSIYAPREKLSCSLEPYAWTEGPGQEPRLEEHKPPLRGHPHCRRERGTGGGQREGGTESEGNSEKGREGESRRREIRKEDHLPISASPQSRSQREMAASRSAARLLRGLRQPHLSSTPSPALSQVCHLQTCSLLTGVWEFHHQDEALESSIHRTLIIPSLFITC